MSKLILNVGGLLLVFIGINACMYESSTTSEYEFFFTLDKDIYQLTDWAEAPQFALWLQNDSLVQTRTLFVTNRTAKDNWEGKSACPNALPYWVERFKKEFNRKRGPDYFHPLPDAYSGATPKVDFLKGFTLNDEQSGWDLFLEINVSGDYNDFYKRSFPDTDSYDLGNGQPSIIYQIKDIQNIEKKEAKAEIIGQTARAGSVVIIKDTVAITSAHRLIKDMKLKLGDREIYLLAQHD